MPILRSSLSKLIVLFILKNELHAQEIAFQQEQHTSLESQGAKPLKSRIWKREQERDNRTLL